MPKTYLFGNTEHGMHQGIQEGAELNMDTWTWSPLDETICVASKDWTLRDKQQPGQWGKKDGPAKENKFLMS